MYVTRVTSDRKKIIMMECTILKGEMLLLHIYIYNEKTGMPHVCNKMWDNKYKDSVLYISSK